MVTKSCTNLVTKMYVCFLISNNLAHNYIFSPTVLSFALQFTFIASATDVYKHFNFQRLNEQRRKKGRQMTYLYLRDKVA